MTDNNNRTDTSSTSIADDDDGKEILRAALAVGVREYALPGIALAVLATKHNSNSDNNDDEFLFAGTDGHANLEQAVPLTLDARFCVGSITKTFVAVCIWQMLDEGTLDLDRTAMDYILTSTTDDCDIQEILERIPNATTSTLRDMLCHQSGIPTWEFAPDWIRAARGSDIINDKIWTPIEMLRYCTSLPPTSALPGERYSYSNTNYTILGLVIEAVSGNTLMSEIRRHILDPLQLYNTYMDSFEDEPPPAPLMPCHYHYATEEFLESAGFSDTAFTKVNTSAESSAATMMSCNNEFKYPIINTSKANLSCEWAAGGMVMSIRDLARYTRALSLGSNRVNHSNKGDDYFILRQAHQLQTYRPPARDEIGDTGTTTNQGGSLAASNERYCQGIAYTKETGAGLGPSNGHGGLTLGFSSRMLWLLQQQPPYDGVVIACATNVGLMHSGFDEHGASSSPWDLFWSEVLLPAVKLFLERQQDQ